MTPEQIIRQLAERGIAVELMGEQIRTRSIGAQITSHDVARIRDKKRGLLSFLKEIERREQIWRKYAESVQAALGTKDHVTILPHLRASLENALHRLAQPILTLPDPEFIQALTDWKNAWIQSIDALKKHDARGVRHVS